MRDVVAVIMLALLSVAPFLALSGHTDEWLAAPRRAPVDEKRSTESGRLEGLRRADRDIQAGTPWVLRFIEWDGDLMSDGVGIDSTTGLPLQNANLDCGTGVDFVAYKAEVSAYNERILAAHADGTLDGLSLSGKLRSKAALRDLLGSASRTVLAEDGDRLGTALGRQGVVYRRETFVDGSESQRLELEGAGGERQTLLTLYPCNYVDRPRALWPSMPRGPFEGVIVDDATTAILRDSEGFAWVIDLVRGLVLQVAGPLP